MYMKPIKKQFARQLRKSQTDTEKVVWEILRNRKFCEYKFRRQHVLEGFVVDFFSRELRLVVEIDGWIHEKRKEYDKARDGILRAKRISVVRIKNEDVVGGLEGILRKLERIALTLSPSPIGRGKQSRKY